MSDYPWENGVFNPACVCGGSINRVNEYCERCAMHDWIYKQADEIKRLREELHAAGDGDTWRAACGRYEDEIDRLWAPLEQLAERSGQELTICGQCGELIIALMDGMSPVCAECAKGQ